MILIVPTTQLLPVPPFLSYSYDIFGMWYTHCIAPLLLYLQSYFVFLPLKVYLLFRLYASITSFFYHSDCNTAFVFFSLLIVFI